MDSPAAETVLVVDDNPVNRNLLKKILGKEGYRVAEAEDGEAAMAAVYRENPDLVLLDIMMPKKDGYAVCAAMVQDTSTVNIPIIFLSAKTRPEDKIRGLRLGAADYVTKPFDKGEILARVRVHLKIRRLTRDLMDANRELRKKQARLDDDLKAAAEIQKSLLPPAAVQVPGAAVAWRFIPSDRIGGDLFNIFPLDESHWGIYMLDVSGHGVPAAMVAVSAYQMLNARVGSLLKKGIQPPPYYEIVSPAAVLGALNREFPIKRFDKFFTVSYLILSVTDGRIRYSSAGHPPPVLLRNDGTVELLKEGGTVIGVGEDIAFGEGQARLFSGDRLFVYTDGITEYRAGNGEFYDEARFYASLQKGKDESLQKQVEDSIQAMMAFGRHQPPEDDVSLLGVAFAGTN